MRRSTANAAVFYVDRHVAEGRAQRPALLAAGPAGGSWTYAQLLEQVERTGFMLCAAGVRPLDRVAIVLPDTLEAAAVALAAMRIGAIPAPMHTRLSDDEYAFVCRDARPRVAVAGGEHVERLLRVRAQTGWPELVAALDGAADAADGGGVVHAAPLLAAGGRSDPAPTRPDDVALLQYTSGSSGQPKGVVHLHRGLLALPGGFGRRLDLRDGDLCFSAAKLFFGYGFGNSLLFPLAAGVPALLRAQPAEPLGVLEAIERARPTVFFGGPALYTALLAAHDSGARCDTSSVRLYVSAGEALDASLFRRWREAFGRPILDGLGSTECLHVFVAGEPRDLRPGSLGRAVAPYEVRLLDERGAPVARGEPGHVHVRGPANAARYWDRPDATRDTMVDGWVRTGDLLRQAPDGSFSYVGRSDDVFKVHGMKVAPLEIETCLNAHPAVAESAVVPAADRSGLTVACAFVRLERTWTPTPQLARTLRAHTRTALSPHKVPRYVRFVDDLPRNGTGKLGRHRLRERAADALLDSAT
jgi:benzoate-CoA ligase family protein